MKSFVLWVLFATCSYLAYTAWSMTEHAIMVGFGVVAAVCAMAAASGNASKKKASASR
jgi:hypothetical protein